MSKHNSSHDKLPAFKPEPASASRLAQRRPNAAPEVTSEDEVEALRAQIVQLEKLASFGKIAAGVAHEINNPLTAILAYADQLARSLKDVAPEQLERVRRISDSAERILGFSRDLVAYSRPSQGTPSPLSLHAILDQALFFCGHLFEKQQVTVTREFAAEEPKMIGLSEQLVQVFVNLLTNACQAMGEGEHVIRITTQWDGAAAVVTVEDSGRGIAEADLERVFEPFFTTKRESGGTGLGLCIVKNIVDAHRGEITVSRREPRGTKFTVTLPATP